MSTLALNSTYRRYGLRAILGALAFIAVMGVLHLPFAKPLLNVFAKKDGSTCPMGWTKAETLTPAQVEARRGAALASTRGAHDAKSRHALGFILETTTREDIETWTAKNQINCRVDRHNAGFDCPNVPATVLPEKGLLEGSIRVLLGFDAQRRLVSVQASGAFSEAEAAAAAAEHFEKLLDQSAGAMHERRGESKAEYLRSMVLAQSRAEWRFHNYNAQVSATNLKSKFDLTLVFQTIPDAG